jgi:hypothetical protein
MDIYKPKGAKCEKCGSPLAFRKLESGKWCPCNVDGSDHWDDCSEAQAKGTYGIKRIIVTERFMGVTYPNHDRPLYSGELPPWD